MDLHQKLGIPPEAKEEIREELEQVLSAISDEALVETFSNRFDNVETPNTGG